MRAKFPYVFERKNSNVLQFRILIPKDLRGHPELPVTGTHIQESLHTTCKHTAEREAGKKAETWKAKFEAIRLGLAVDGISKLRERGRNIVKHGTRANLSDFLDTELDPLKDRIKEYLEADSLPPAEAINRTLAKEHALGLRFDSDKPTEQDKRHALKNLQKVLDSAWDAVAEELSLETAPSYTSRLESMAYTATASPAPQADTAHGRTYRETIEELMQAGERGTGQEKNVRRHLTRFVDTVGNSENDPVATVLSKANVLSFKETLLGSDLSAQTVVNIFRSLKQLTRYASGEGYIQGDPCLNVKLPKVQTTAFIENEKKIAFTFEEIQSMKEALQEELTTTRDYRRNLRALVVLTALYTGARQAEICQARGEDFDLKAGTFLITDRHQEQKLKNTSSHRLIPLHPELLKNKTFTKAVKTAQKEKKRVFTPHVAPDSAGFAKPVAKWFGDWKKTIEGVAEVKRKDFHSLRRSFITQWDLQGLDNTVGELITGHTRTDVSKVHSGSYISETDLEGWRAELHKLKI